MALWWESLNLFMKFMWGIALTSSLIFIIQSIITFIGGDTDLDVGGADASADDPSGTEIDSGMNILTVRNFVNFFLGFGWSAVLFADGIPSVALLLVVSTLVGVAFVVLMMLLLKWLASMQQSGNINVYEVAVGCQGNVYFPIPEARSGEGKVQISINNSVREYDALTDGDALPTGTRIRVVEVIDASTLLVEPLNSLII